MEANCEINKGLKKETNPTTKPCKTESPFCFVRFDTNQTFYPQIEYKELKCIRELKKKSNEHTHKNKRTAILFTIV